jgi:peptide/bleomycin uptake transporter
MFKSFFPSPKLFFTSALAWTLFNVLLWFFAAKDWGQYVGLPNPAADVAPIIGISIFWSKPFLWLYIYFAAITAIFAAVWWRLSSHEWFSWSILGSALIIFSTYFQVQISVAINAWYGPFYDMIQAALAKPNSVTTGQLFGQLLTFAWLAGLFVFVYAFTKFFINHYVFRWRTAMNNYFMKHWDQLRKVEGASQRVQDDTMRFARGAENQGAGLIDAVMTLIAFLPILAGLSTNVKVLPIVGEVPQPLVAAGIFWAIFGMTFLSLIGWRLPGLEFKNQRVEAAYRKELVYGEDDPNRAQPQTVREFFTSVTKNYFTLYKNYFFFSLGWRSYLQADNIFGFFLLIPTIAAGAITLGVMQQILNSFGQVRDSFLYLVNQWPTIVELISIYKRLRTFEAAIEGEEIKPQAEYLDTDTSPVA